MSLAALWPLKVVTNRVVGRHKLQEWLGAADLATIIALHTDGAATFGPPDVVPYNHARLHVVHLDLTFIVETTVLVASHSRASRIARATCS